MVQYVLDNRLYKPENLIAIVQTPAGLCWTLVHEADSLGHMVISERLKKFTLFALKEVYANSYNYIICKSMWDSDDEPLIPCAPHNSPQKM